VIDLHAHYPMHVGPADHPWASLRLWSSRGRASFMDRWDSILLNGSSRLWNHESMTSGPRVTIDGLRQGGFRAVFSVLYTPLLEMGNHYTKLYSRQPPYGGPPEDRYFDVLMRQMSAVETRLTTRHSHRVRIARSPAELDEVLSTDSLALMHCVEGGFSLGSSPEFIQRAVRVLADRGVAYITIAHLVWRNLATNVPCIPFISDDKYNWIFPQPAVGLTELGRAAIRAMVAEGILVDITHMSSAAIDDTFVLLDDLDPAKTVPVIASHVGFRFGHREYNLTAQTVMRIAERGGVIGLMLSPFFMADGRTGGRPSSWEESFELLCRHIDAIQKITGSDGHVAVGSDLDGFVKPTLVGFENSERLGSLGFALEERYGSSGADAIRSTNVLRVLRAGWRGRSHDGGLAKPST
jgi:membrane dipeptidase